MAHTAILQIATCQNYPELQILPYCKLLSIFFTACWPQGAGGYPYIYIYIYISALYPLTPIPMWLLH